MNASHSYRSRFVGHLGWLLVFSASFAQGKEPAEVLAGEPLAAAIKALDARVLPVDDKAKLQRMLPDYLRDKLRNANQASSDEWSQIRNKNDWEFFRNSKIAALRDALVIEAGVPRVLQSRVTKQTAGDRFVVENVLYETRPGIWVSANLYRPEKPGDKCPGIILSHSHHSPKTQGELQDMGMTWARAGCYVLVPDHLGHGERRQHSYVTAKDFAKPFAVSRQDYHFRYDLAVQLSLLRESLMGWFVHDLRCGVTFLCEQPHVDRKRILLLGGVAGGGDPAGVTAAVDDRIACVVPFNFGGPQPETKYPLPDDAETSFNYAGGGSWESTRNLVQSGSGGFLPWVIVGSVAPRKLIHAHEFSWDRDRDPVWKRYEQIFSFYDAKANLAFAHGTGTLKGQPPEASHCGNIGPPHRKLIHEAFAKWFDIHVKPEEEYSKRLPTEELLCWTEALRKELGPSLVRDYLAKQFPIHPKQFEAGGNSFGLAWGGEVRNTVVEGVMHANGIEPAPKAVRDETDNKTIPGIRVRRFAIETAPGITVPAVILQRVADKQPPLVVGLAFGGKQRFLQERAQEIAKLLDAGLAFCAIDPRGIGETSPGDSGLDRSSTNTSLSSSAQMVGELLMVSHAQDAYGVILFLRDTKAFQKFAVWGDSFALVNPPDADLRIPHNIDGRPKISAPQGCQMAYLVACCFPKECAAVYLHRPLFNPRGIWAQAEVYAPHAAILPGIGEYWAGIPCMAASLMPLPFCVENPIDAGNQELSPTALEADLVRIRADYKTKNVPDNFQAATGKEPAVSAATWLIKHTKN